MKTSIVLALSLFAGVFAGVRGESGEYSDLDIKRQIVFAGRCYHAEDMDSNYEWAFRMSGCDTNRYARVLCELAGENTNQTRRALALLGVYKTPQSLPFLYAYATNAEYGAYAMKAIFDIEGVTSNSLSAARDYLFLTNKFSFAGIDERSDTCVKLLTRVNNDPVLAEFRLEILGLATNFLQNVELMPNVLDGTLCGQYEGFRFSRGRLSMLRSARQRVTQELADITGNDPEASGKIHCYTFQTNYLSTSINELVAYPESDLPD